MNVTSERLPGSLGRLEIAIPQERVDQEMERAYRRLAGRVNVPGFRRGKAPRVLVERALGEGALLQEAIEAFVPKAIEEAVEQENLTVVGEAQSFNQLGTDPFRFEVTIPLAPAVTLGDYRAVRAERQPIEVTDVEIDEVVERLRQDAAAWVAPEPRRPSRDGDRLTIDLQAFHGDEPVGEKQEEMTVELGAGVLSEELDRRLVAAEPGGDYEVDVTLPEDHPNEDTAGETLRYRIHVHNLEEKRLSELDDAFVAEAVPGIETVESLRARVRANLEATKAGAERERLADEVVSKLVETAEVEMPDVLVDREAERRMERLESELRSQGLTAAQLFASLESGPDELRERYRTDARTRLIRGLVLAELGKAEQIAVEDGEIDAEIERIAETLTPEERESAAVTLGSDEWRDRLRPELYDRKVLNLAVELATGQPLDAQLVPSEDEPITRSDVEIVTAIGEAPLSSAADADEDPAVHPETPGAGEPEENPDEARAERGVV